MTDTTPAAPAPDATPAVPSDPSAIATRDAELTALYEHDRNTYLYSDNGKLANEHLAIRKAQQATEKADPTPAEQAEGDVTDADDIDLDAPADDAEGKGDEAGEGEAADGEGSLDLSAYEALPEGTELNETGEALIGIVNKHCAEHGIDPEGRNGLFELHTKLIEAQTARLSEMDKAASKETAAALTERLGGEEAYDGYMATAREAAKLMPKTLRDALKAARMPDGRKVAHLPELAEFLHQVASRQGQPTPQPQQDRTTMLQAELAEIDALMSRDIDEYRRPWRATGVSASERRLQIARELGSEGPARPNPSDLKAEERELIRLRNADIDMFRFGNWRGTGRPAADRLAAIQGGRG